MGCRESEHSLEWGRCANLQTHCPAIGDDLDGSIERRFLAECAGHIRPVSTLLCRRESGKMNGISFTMDLPFECRHDAVVNVRPLSVVFGTSGTSNSSEVAPA
ncbi:hypothetical protein LMG31841_04034 [Paraburkholderia saeva]|jgi:hypothetical protein|uniref:Uncharacterized protein n=1 Tax=Paraburkholderia saeva TaxID=2777537 RepID=A0A9N8S027_9BURK|nr:hypothetical protein LMG31841_04034 [Paraburkholderia saeva]